MNRVILRLLAAFILALGVVPLSAGGASAASYVIRGTITGLNASGSSVGVAGATVAIVPVTGGGGQVQATTSSTGAYSISAYAGGTYKVEVWCPAGSACDQNWAGPYYVGNTFDLGDATAVSVVDGTPTTANLALKRWGTVTGTVVDDLGQAPTVPVTVTADAGWQGQRTSVTNADGTYTLTRLYPVYHQSFTAADAEHVYDPGWIQADGTSTTVHDTNFPGPTIAAGPSVTTFNFTLPRSVGVYVTAKAPDGTLISDRPLGAELDVFWDGSGASQWSSTITQGGHAFLEGKLGDAVTVCLTDDWYDSVGSSQPEVLAIRYANRCYGDAATADSATRLTLSEQTRRHAVTITLPVAGKSLVPQAPWVTGSLEVGQTLTVDPGTWGPSGVALTYQWYRSGSTADAPIAGATSRSYTLTADDDQQLVWVEVTGTLSGYKTAVLDGNAGWIGSPTASTPAPPTIQGTLRQGQTLTAQNGSFSPSGGSPNQSWYVGGKLTAWGTTLTLTSAQVGLPVTLRTSYWSNDTQELRLSTTATGVVQGVFTTTPIPTISGTKAVGYTLTANPGAWSPTPDSFSYQWYRSGAAISGATASTYKLTSYDLGKTMTVKVTGSKTNYTAVSKTSAATSAVLNSFATAPTPTISGTKAVGYTLTANPGTWSPTPDSYLFQWYRSGTAISGATASTYKLTSYDKGKTMTVKVTARKTGYLSAARTSAATTAVLGVYSTAPTPTISGTKKVGYTLTANAGTWSPTPSSFKYQWFRGTTAISGATYRTYKLTSYDMGKVVKVRVTPVLTGYYSPGKYSAGYTIS